MHVTTLTCHDFCNIDMEIVFDELIKRGIESSFTMPIMSSLRAVTPESNYEQVEDTDRRMSKGPYLPGQKTNYPSRPVASVAIYRQP